MNRRCMSLAALPVQLAAALLAISNAPAAEHASTAGVKVASGPHAGTYTFDSEDACTVAALDRGKPASFSAVLTTSKAMLSIDMPSVDPKRASELQIELTIADPNSTASRRDTASARYLIDTRPDASLAPYQLQERGKGGMTGRGSAKLLDSGDKVKLVFAADTKQGVHIEGTVDCREVDRELGR